MGFIRTTSALFMSKATPTSILDWLHVQEWGHPNTLYFSSCSYCTESSLTCCGKITTANVASMIKITFTYWIANFKSVRIIHFQVLSLIRFKICLSPPNVVSTLLSMSLFIFFSKFCNIPFDHFVFNSLLENYSKRGFIWFASKT